MTDSAVMPPVDPGFALPIHDPELAAIDAQLHPGKSLISHRAVSCNLRLLHAADCVLVFD